MIVVSLLCIILSFFMFGFLGCDFRNVGVWLAYPFGFWSWIIGRILIGFDGFFLGAEP